MEKDQSIFITLEDQRRLHALVRGKGTPILCLSGFGCDHYNFLELAESLENHYQLILLDNRGMGASDKAFEDYSIDDLAEDAAVLMERLGHQHYGVLGISMGGFIAQSLALKYPKRVSSLGLLCTTGPGEKFIQLPKVTAKELIRLYSLSKQEVARQSTAAYTHPNLKKRDPKQLEKIMKLRLEHSSHIEQLLLQQKAVEHFMQKEIDYGQICVPTFILSGSHDRFVSPENSNILNAEIHNSKLSFIEETDHLFFMEKPKETSQLIKQYLAEAICP